MGSGSDGGDDGPGRNLGGQNVIKMFKNRKGTEGSAPLQDRLCLAARIRRAVVFLKKRMIVLEKRAERNFEES